MYLADLIQQLACFFNFTNCLVKLVNFDILLYHAFERSNPINFACFELEER